jgi:hypothetical protein
MLVSDQNRRMFRTPAKPANERHSSNLQISYLGSIRCKIEEELLRDYADELQLNALSNGDHDEDTTDMLLTRLVA